MQTRRLSFCNTSIFLYYLFILFFRELAGGMNISPVAHPKNENISKQKIKWT